MINVTLPYEDPMHNLSFPSMGLMDLIIIADPMYSKTKVNGGGVVGVIVAMYWGN